MRSSEAGLNSLLLILSSYSRVEAIEAQAIKLRESLIGQSENARRLSIFGGGSRAKILRRVNRDGTKR